MLLAERDRLREHFTTAPPQLLLAIQDTTDLDMTGNRVSGQLGSLNYANRKGYYAYNHLLLNQQGISLGLFGQFLWNRDAAFFRQDRSLWPLKEKESVRWVEQFEQLQGFFADFPQHKVIDICDREADFYELFQARRLPNVHLLVRSSKDRELPDEERLWAKLASQTESCTYKAEIFDEKGKGHEVTFQVKHSPVTIQVSYRAKRDQPDQSNPVELHGILVEQVGPVQDWQKKPIVWRLLTTLPVESFEQVLEVVGFYILRWRIEEFHYVLKQGSKIEATQIEELGAVENAITLYSLLAWKVLNLRFAGRATDRGLWLYPKGFLGTGNHPEPLGQGQHRPQETLSRYQAVQLIPQHACHYRQVKKTAGRKSALGWACPTKAARQRLRCIHIVNELMRFLNADLR